MLAVLRGDLSRLGAFFDANIFHPAPLALGYSEHFIAQAIQVLPVYAATGNPILCYNLLFLSTFVVSGLGTYLLARELTGSGAAGLTAGLLFALAPYRLAHGAELEVLSAQWMPLALYGLRRYFASAERPRRARLTALVVASGSLVALSLSSVYYLAYFAPVAVAYVIWETAARKAWRAWRVWAPAAAACGLAVALSLPAAVPYAAVRHAQPPAVARGEVLRHSADVYSYATAAPTQPVWGGVMRAFPKAGVELFPGTVPLLLAAIALAGTAARAWRDAPRGGERRHRAVIAGVAAALAGIHLAAIVAALLYRQVLFEIAFFDVSISDVDRLLLQAAALVGVALALSPRARHAAAALARGPGVFAAGGLAAAWLSLGPVPQALGRPVELVAPYELLAGTIPGVSLLRAPSRFAMIAALMLAVLGGYGAAALGRSRAGRLAAIAIALAFLVETVSPPFPMNGAGRTSEYNLPEGRVYRPGRAPAVYRAVAGLPPDAVIAELPIGDRALDLRAMFYSTAHWRPLVNGAGHAEPAHYDYVVVALSDVPRHPNAALEALRVTGATHVIVHEAAYPGAAGAATAAALSSEGAFEVFRDGQDVLLELAP